MATYGKLKQGETINEAAARTGQDPTQMEVKGGMPVADAPITTKPALTPNPRDAVKPALVPNPRDMVKPAMTPNPRDAMQQPMPTTGAPMPVSAQKQPTPTKVSEPPLKAPTQFLGDVPATPSPAPETKYGVQGASIAGFGGTGETSVRDYTDIMKMFNDFRTGVRDANFQPKTQAERQAIQTFNAYQAHKNMTGRELFDAIRTGQMTPDPRNLLWTSMYQGGQPTMAQKEAYAAWQKFITTGGAKLAAERRNPFLVGPRPNTPENINEDLNKIQDEAIVDESKATVPAKPALEPAPADETKIADAVFNDVVKNTTQEQLDAAVKGLVDFSTKNTLPEPGYQKNLRALTTEFGTNALEDDVNFLKEDLRNLEVQRRERTQMQRDKTLPTGVIAGRIGEIERQESERADYLNNRLQTAQDILNSRYKIVGLLQDAYGNDYDAAVKNYDAKYKQQMDLIDMFSGINKDEQTLERQARNDAQANLTIMYNAVQDGSLDPTKMTADQKSQITKLEARAGYPTGTFDLMQKKIGLDKAVTTKERIDENGNKFLDVVTISPTGEVGVQTIETGIDYQKLQAAEASKALSQKRDMDVDVAEAALTGLYKGKKTTKEEQRIINNMYKERQVAVSEAYVTIAENRLEELKKENASTEAIKKQQLILDTAKLYQKEANDLMTEDRFGNPITMEAKRSPEFQSLLDELASPSGSTNEQSPYQEVPNLDRSSYFKNVGKITAENGSPYWSAGLDVDLKKGDPLPSPVTGRVVGVKNGYNGGFGNQVQIEDANGNIVWLSHMDSVDVKVGDQVEAGTQVGKGGNSGNTIAGKNGDGSHVDITILKKGKKPNYTNKGSNDSFFTAPEVKAYINKEFSGDTSEEKKPLTKQGLPKELLDAQNTVNSVLKSFKSSTSSTPSALTKFQK